MHRLEFLLSTTAATQRTKTSAIAPLWALVANRHFCFITRVILKLVHYVHMNQCVSSAGVFHTPLSSFRIQQQQEVWAKKGENDEIAEPHNFFDSICFNSCLTYSFSFIHNKTMCTRRWVLDLSLCIIYERIMGRGNRWDWQICGSLELLSLYTYQHVTYIFFFLFT